MSFAPRYDAGGAAPASPQARSMSHALASAAGDELSKDNAFAIIWHDTRDGVRVSIRSQREGGLDVSEIAKIYGGGGHRNAAGFTVSRDLAYQLGITR